MDCPEGRPLRLLVLFIHNHLGGAMTALVNFVNALDPARYQVDLLFYELKGQVEGIRPEVRILPPACSRGHLLAKALSPAYLSNYLRAQYYLRAKGDRLLARQLRAQQGCRFSRRLEGEYDLAVAFELAWPFYYMMGSRCGQNASWSGTTTTTRPSATGSIGTGPISTGWTGWCLSAGSAWRSLPPCTPATGRNASSCPT